MAADTSKRPTPNLETLVDGPITSTRKQVEELWFLIRRGLERGKTVKTIWEHLQLDGISASYPTFCRYVSALQKSPDHSASGRQLQPKSATTPDRDPFENVRRLRGRERPGFHYPETLSEEELFEPKKEK